jgi:type IV pilus assembly protein PilE
MNMLTIPFPLPQRRQRSERGFSLIELLIALVIVGVLTAVALPSYKSYMTKSKRGAAQTAMMDLANREEQFLLANRVYADKATIVASGYGLPADVANNYSFDIVVDAGTVPGYTMTFTAINGQAPDGALSLTSGGVKLPANKW